MWLEKFSAAWFVLQECADSSFNEAAAEVWSPRARMASHPSAEALWKGSSCDAARNPKPRTAEAVEFCWNIKVFSVFCFSSGSSNSLDVWTPQKWTSRNPPEWRTLIKPERYRWRRCWQSCVPQTVSSCETAVCVVSFLLCLFCASVRVRTAERRAHAQSDSHSCPRSQTAHRRRATGAGQTCTPYAGRALAEA